MKPIPLPLIDAHKYTYDEDKHVRTPEGKVKTSINRVLQAFTFVYSFMPVQNGMGAAGVDYHCVAGKYFQLSSGVELIGVAFFIEAKKPGSRPSDRQEFFLSDRRQMQGAKTFVIDGEHGLDELVEWLAGIEDNNERLCAIQNS